MHDLFFEVDVYSHFFIISKIQNRALGLVFSFSNKLTRWTWVKEPGQKPAFKPTHLFGTKTKNNSEFRFHSGLLNDFLEHVKRGGMPDFGYVVRRAPLYQPAKIQATLNPKYELRPYQQKALEHIANKDIASNSRLISFAMGQGKTLTSLASCSAIGNRVAVVILPQYIDKWCSDIQETLNVPTKDIMTVQGGGQLRGLMSLAEENQLTSEFLVLSVTTLQNYYKLYETAPEDLDSLGYVFKPDVLWEKLGVGVIIVDETHQHINSVYRTMLYTHVPLLIALSATLLTEEPVVKRVHDAMYPRECRFEGEAMDKYIKVYPVEYNFKELTPPVRTTEYGSKTYSHNTFEKSIMQKPHIKQSYYKMIKHFVELGFIQHHKPGDKMIIFASTIAMCTDLTNYLKKEYPQLDVRRYVEDDLYENVIDADIRITTVLSAGTAVDIPMLTCALQTVSIASSVSNLQSFGRLRKLKDRDVRFYYLYCRQIPKQMEYHQKRLELFRSRAASIKDTPYMTLLA